MIKKKEKKEKGTCWARPQTARLGQKKDGIQKQIPGWGDILNIGDKGRNLG